jgi:hypothetical protein
LRESEYRKKLRAGEVKMYRRADLAEDKIVLLEKLGKNEPQIFKERHISEVADKIKNLMNRKDNVFANEILRKMKNKTIARRFVAGLGIASRDYVKEFPPYVQMYGKHIEDTVIGLTRELKREMVDRDMIKMLLEKGKTRSIEERPLLYSFDFKLDAFLRERKLRSVTQFLKKHDEEVWSAVCSNPDDMLEYITCAGDVDVQKIWDLIDENRHRAHTQESSTAFLTTEDSNTNLNVLNQKKKKLSYLNNFIDKEKLRKSRFLVNNTKNLLFKMRSKIVEEEENSSQGRSSIL